MDILETLRHRFRRRCFQVIAIRDRVLAIHRAERSYSSVDSGESKWIGDGNESEEESEEQALTRLSEQAGVDDDWVRAALINLQPGKELKVMNNECRLSVFSLSLSLSVSFNPFDQQGHAWLSTNHYRAHVSSIYFSLLTCVHERKRWARSLFVLLLLVLSVTFPTSTSKIKRARFVHWNETYVQYISKSQQSRKTSLIPWDCQHLIRSSERQWSSLISDNEQFVRDESRRKTIATSQMSWWTRTRTSFVDSKCLLFSLVHLCAMRVLSTPFTEWLPLETERKISTQQELWNESAVHKRVLRRIFILMEQSLIRLVQLISERTRTKKRPSDWSNICKYPLLNVCNLLSYDVSLYRGSERERKVRTKNAVDRHERPL